MTEIMANYSEIWCKASISVMVHIQRSHFGPSNPRSHPMPLVANAPLYTEHPYMSTSVIYFLTFLALWPLFRIFACRKLLRATQLCPQTKHSENCRNFLRLLFSRTVVVIMWVILVNMEISVILGHEKTKTQNIID